MSLAVLSVVGVVLDAIFGEPKRWHPLVAFGALANYLERRFNGACSGAPKHQGSTNSPLSLEGDHCRDAGGRATQDAKAEGWGEGGKPAPELLAIDPGLGWRSHGVTAWALAVLPLTLLTWLLTLIPHIGWLVHAVALYAALGLRSLGEHADPVALALRANDLAEARKRVGYMVSRETAELDSTAVAKAATESVLENGSDAVFAALFWFALAGAPGVVLYRLSNTLDAMWGYRNARFERFGWAAAKIDDVLNFIPARLVALTYALLGNTRRSLRCWREQAPQWDSPNAGPVMAAGAGALDVALGGAARYHGELHQRPLLGAGDPPKASDIWRALALVRQGVLLWLVVILLLGVLLHA